MLRDDAKVIRETCERAMREAAASPGTYGGRYVGRRYNRKANRDEYDVTDDDPEGPAGRDESFDIFAHVSPTEVRPMGRARYWLDARGRYLDETTRKPVELGQEPIPPMTRTDPTL